MPHWVLPELTFWHGRRGKELDGALWGLQMESRAKHLHLGLNGVRGSLPEVLAMRFGDKARRGNGEQQRPRDTSFKHSHKRRSETPGRSTPASGSSGRAPRVGAPTQTPGHGSARLGAGLAASPPAVPVPSPHLAAGGAVTVHPLHGLQEHHLPGCEARSLGAGLPEEPRCCIDKLGLTLQAPAAPNARLSYGGRSCVRNTRPLRFGRTCSAPL